MQTQCQMLILSSPEDADLFLQDLDMSQSAQLISQVHGNSAADISLSIYVDKGEMLVCTNLDSYSCDVLMLAIPDIVEQQNAKLPNTSRRKICELVLIGEGRKLLEQALALAGSAKKVTIVRRKCTDACCRVIQHYLSRMQIVARRKVMAAIPTSDVSVATKPAVRLI